MSWSALPDPNGTRQQPPRSNGFFDSLRNRAESDAAARHRWRVLWNRRPARAGTCRSCVLTIGGVLRARRHHRLRTGVDVSTRQSMDAYARKETFNGNFDVAFVGG